MFEKFDEAAADVISASRHECLRLRTEVVLPEHLLLALTRDPANIAARALATMNIKADNLQQEVERSLRSDERLENQPTAGRGTVSFEQICFSETVRQIFDRSHDFRRFFGRSQVAPEHILLSIVDLKIEATEKVLEELGANLTFLRRQIMSLVAKEDCLNPSAPVVRHTVISGLNELILEKLEGVESLKRLAQLAATSLSKMPERSEIGLMVILAYVPDFLLVQTAYQRYLLEETLKLLSRRCGSVDNQVSATIVESSAQHLRQEVRATIEYIWSHELRLLNQMPDEAEHDLIGSVIEDLWWTHSEEIALHEVFDEALDDYRRKQQLNLQKRRIEIAQRLTKLRSRLEETIKQCFLKRSLSA